MTEQYLTLAEIKDLLLKEQSTRILTLEQNYALEHATKFAKLDAEQSRKLVEELIEIETVTEPVACKIVDLMPVQREGVDAIFLKERITLEEDVAHKIIDKVKQYL